jgi:hypothetical protein
MANKHRALPRAVAVFLTLGLLNLCVLFGAGTSRAATSPGASETSSSKLLVGRLNVAEQQSVFVNGNVAGAGTTIFSGMRLQTPEGVNATVQLGALGQLSIEPGSDLTLDFSNSRVDVKIAAGDAALTTTKDVTGTLTTSDGRVLKSENSKAGTLASKTTKARRGWNDWSDGEKAAAILIPAAIAAIIIIVVVADDDDESPARP